MATQNTSIFAAARHAIVSVFDTVGAVATTAQEAVEISTGYVHNRAVEQRLTDKHFIQTRTAATLTELDAELEEDPKLKDMFARLESEFA